MKIKDGIIELDSVRARFFGFTGDRFEGYLWKEGDYIIISIIISKQRGNFCKLIDKIRSQGFGVKIPTPLGRMRIIVEEAGYKQTREDTEICEGVEIWVLEPTTLDSTP